MLLLLRVLLHPPFVIHSMTYLYHRHMALMGIHWDFRLQSKTISLVLLLKIFSVLVTGGSLTWLCVHFIYCLIIIAVLTILLVLIYSLIFGTVRHSTSSYIFPTSFLVSHFALNSWFLLKKTGIRNQKTKIWVTLVIATAVCHFF